VKSKNNETGIRYGLADETLIRILSVFQTFPEIDQAILYGSRARGNYRSGSDIDLTFKGTELNLNVMNRVSMALEDLLLPYTFDLSIFHQISNPDLLEHIDRVGVLFYSRSSMHS